MNEYTTKNLYVI